MQNLQVSGASREAVWDMEIVEIEIVDGVARIPIHEALVAKGGFEVGDLFEMKCTQGGIIMQTAQAVDYTEIRNARIASELGATEVTEEQIAQYIQKQCTGGAW